MVSYNWDDQLVVVEIAKHLKKEGFKVWLDLDEMTGSTLESMANAVESSSVVLVCMSRKYKESANCRLEGEYAFKKKKIIIPLMMQSNWEPEGWLGAIAGTKLYFSFSDPSSYQASLEGVLKELKRHSPEMANHETVALLAQPVPAPVILSPPPSPSLPPQLEVKSWSPQKVSEWMKQIGMRTYLIEKFHDEDMDGKSLAGLAFALRKGSPVLWATAAIQPGGTLGFVNLGELAIFI